MSELSAKSKTPAIRFKGFSGEWEEKALGNESEIKAGGTPSTNIKEYWNPKDIPWMSSGEINKKRLYSTDNMISRHGFNNSSAQWIPENSVLIALAGQGKTRGMVAINNIPLTTNQSIAAIIPSRNINYEYLYQNLSKRYDELRMRSSGDGSRGGLNKQIISEVDILAPKLDEQTKIGNFFQQLDRLIAQHQQKHDKLLTVKKALLEKMFPKQGETQPAIRFKGFSEAWEGGILSEHADLLTGNPFDSKKFAKSGFLLIRGINVKRGYIDNSDNISEYWPSSFGLEAYILSENDIVIQMDGALIGRSYAKISSSNLPALLVQRVTRIRSEKLNTEIIYQYIERDFLKHISKIKTETAVPHLSLNDIKNFPISIPTRKEQTKISSLFQQLDTLINQHQSQLTKLNNIKQAMLAKMFV